MGNDINSTSCSDFLQKGWVGQTLTNAGAIMETLPFSLPLRSLHSRPMFIEIVLVC
jgi:hypothetical protein